jgi:radical SAM protein with 4Fe4S-binding SPASM domain
VGLRVILFTNARLMTPDLADLLARVPPLLPVEVTVYGMTAESYERVACAPGSFAELRRGVEALRARSVPFVVKGVVLPANREDVAAFTAWASAELGMTHPPGLVAFLDLRQRRDCDARNRRIRGLRLRPVEGLEILRRAAGDDRRAQREFCARFMGAQGGRLFACGAGRSVAVDAYGRLQPCLALRAPELGYDLRHGSLALALRDFFPKLRALETCNPAYLERCARCFLKGLCEQCPAKSWAEHGTLDTPVEYWCDIAHEQARELGLLSLGEKAWQVTDSAARVARLVGPPAALMLPSEEQVTP